jgi:hypothetical protein
MLIEQRPGHFDDSTSLPWEDLLFHSCSKRCNSHQVSELCLNYWHLVSGLLLKSGRQNRRLRFSYFSSFYQALHRWGRTGWVILGFLFIPIWGCLLPFKHWQTLLLAPSASGNRRDSQLQEYRTREHSWYRTARMPNQPITIHICFSNKVP